MNVKDVNVTITPSAFTLSIDEVRNWARVAQSPVTTRGELQEGIAQLTLSSAVLLNRVAELEAKLAEVSA